MFGQRILILVPHPDDEIVACAAAIGRARAQGAQIFALYLTHGCIARETLWPWQRRSYDTFIAKRREEGEMVARYLGITPIGWSPLPARHLWRNLQDIYKDIQSAVTRYSIDQIWTPAYEGGNADHDALNAISSLFSNQISILEFAEYNFANGAVNSQKFPTLKGTEQTLTLSADEKASKQHALKLYKSEQKNLNYVACDHETFRPIAPYDYSQIPHKGTLWYARFQWVPFQHPRVDFTNPRDVSKAITSFLEANAPLAPAKQ